MLKGRGKNKNISKRFTGYKLENTNGEILKKAFLALLPIGSTEFHGPASPTGTDTFIAYKIAEEVAKRVNGIVLPPLWFGYSPLHADFPGTISLRNETIVNVLQDVLTSLAHQEVKRVLIINGHDGNVPCLEIAAMNVRRNYPQLFVASTTWWELTRNDPEVKSLFSEYGGKGHGGAEEVAMVMTVDENLVDLSQASDAYMMSLKTKSYPAPFLQHDLEIIFRDALEITGKGFEGLPKEATREKGEIVLRKTVDKLVTFVNEMEERSWRLGDQK